MITLLGGMLWAAGSQRSVPSTVSCGNQTPSSHHTHIHHCSMITKKPVSPHPVPTQGLHDLLQGEGEGHNGVGQVM
jgi:hypothetical protein